MKLFLASSADKTIHLLKDFIPKIGKRVLFIANAADMYDGDTFWIDCDREAFKKLGYELTEVDLRVCGAEEFRKLLATHDIVHVCGGSVYYLMYLLRERGVEQTLIEAIKDEQIIYTGTSAGSIIVSESIRPFSYDEEEIEHIKKVPDHTGLGLINFVIAPHSNNPDFGNSNKEIVKHTPYDPTPILFLNDNQAVWLEENSFRVIKN